MALAENAGQDRKDSGRSGRILIALSIVPGLVVMSRALPQGWPQVGLTFGSIGSTQVILLLGGLSIAGIGMFLCHSLLPQTRPAGAAKLGLPKRALFAATLCAIFAVLMFGVGEVALRVTGQMPWQPSGQNPYVEGGGKAFLKHATLGYTHVPGKMTFTLWDGYTFTVTHGPDTLRITRPADSPKNVSALEEIWVFGCSFTHGWSVNDDETYPWLLDEMLSNYRVVNFGVTGYGTLHSLIQLQENLANGRRPALAVLAYASFHDERNTFQRSRRKVTGSLQQPHARLNESDELVISHDHLPYHELPGMRHSAVLHAIERYYNQRETCALRSFEVSKAIIAEFAETCAEHGIKIALAGIDDQPGTAEMLQHFARKGIPTVDISVDLSLSEYNNKPHDGHPSAAAHRQYAGKLYRFLDESGFAAGCEHPIAPEKTAGRATLTADTRTGA